MTELGYVLNQRFQLRVAQCSRAQHALQCSIVYAVMQHEADLINGELSCSLLLKMDKAIALGLVSCICGYFARQDAAKGTEGVMQRLVVDVLVQVLDKDVA